MSIRRKARIGFITLVMLAGLIGTSCGGAETAGPDAELPAGGRGVAGAPNPAPAKEPALSLGGSSVVDRFQIPGISQKIIKTARVSVHVREGTFQGRFQEAAMVASRHGGFVSSSRTSEARLRSGEMVIRIPASEFEATMSELKALGTVRSEQVSGQDVTAQFVDLQARLRNWEAQEEVLLRLMGRSKTIADSLKVQRTLQDVQLAIEEIRGKLRVLEDQTDLSTITLSMREAGQDEAKGGLTFILAFRQAIHAIATVFAGLVIGLGYVLPILLVGFGLLLMWLVYRRLRSRVAARAAPGAA